MDTLAAYHQLQAQAIFSRADVEPFVKARRTAYALIEKLIEEGLAVKIRKNLYTAVDSKTGQLMANPYQIACSVTDSAYLCRSSALKYHGLVEGSDNQIMIASETRFHNFEFNNIQYNYIISLISEGVISSGRHLGVRVTDRERTIVDYIKDFDKISSLFDLLECLETMEYLDEAKLWTYLSAYDVQFLYQKVGFLASTRQTGLNLSGDFIDSCRGKVRNSIRYLTEKAKKSASHNVEWGLMVPRYLLDHSR